MILKGMPVSLIWANFPLVLPLFPDAHTRYFATGGTISEKQKDLLKGAFEKIHALGGEIIIATDRDEAGQKLALEIAKIAPSGSIVYRHVPDIKRTGTRL